MSQWDRQGELGLPVPERPPPDFEGDARRELNAALVQARHAVRIGRPTWDYRKQRYWRIVFPQMSGWLPTQERETLVAEFMVELERIEALFGEEERNGHG